jgi:sodium transport system permease protein
VRARGGFARDVVVVFVNEIRVQFRDGHVLLSTLLLPLLLYPLVFWATGEFITVGRGSLERTRSRIGLPPTATTHPLVRRIHHEKGATLLPTEEGDAPVQRGEIDAYLDIRGEDPRGSDATIIYDASRPRSVEARDRLNEWIVEARRDALAESMTAKGLSPSAASVFGREYTNVATPGQMGGYLLGLLLPLTMVAMTSMGAFYPAIDVLVGERERRTLESLLATGASRAAIVVGKYLTVVAAAVVAGSLNLGSMLLTGFQFIRSMGELGADEFALPATAVPTMLLGSLLIGAFLGAAMVLLASLARTFKEGQSLVTPFYSLSILPAVVAVFPGFRLTTGTALVPIANVALMMRGALQGDLDAGPVLIALAWNLALTALLLALASWILRQEDVLVGEGGGSLLQYLRRRLAGARA